MKEQKKSSQASLLFSGVSERPESARILPQIGHSDGTRVLEVQPSVHVVIDSEVLRAGSMSKLATQRCGLKTAGAGLAICAMPFVVGSAYRQLSLYWPSESRM